MSGASPLGRWVFLAARLGLKLLLHATSGSHDLSCAGCGCRGVLPAGAYALGAAATGGEIFLSVVTATADCSSSSTGQTCVR